MPVDLGNYRDVIGSDPNRGIKGDQVRPELFNRIHRDLRSLAGAPTGEEWTAADLDLSHLKTQRYAVRQWLPTATALAQEEPGALWSLAAAEVKAAGGGALTGPAAHYPFETGLQLQDTVYITMPGRGATHFDFSAATSWVGGTYASNISGDGTLTALPALSGDVTKGASSVTFASAPTLSPGDEVIFHSTVDYSFSPYRSYYKEGERCTVRTVSSTTVTFEQRLKASHLSASTNTWKVNPIRTGISGVRLTGQTGKRLLRIALGSNLILDDLELKGSNQSLAWLDRCYRSVVRDLWGSDHQTSISLNYGLLIGNCQDVAVSNVEMYTTRHSITVTGAAADGSIPNRNIMVTDSVFGGSDPAYGGDLHGNSERVTFSNVKFPNGFQLGGDLIDFFNCEFRTRGLSNTGVTMGASEMLGADFHFHNCKWVAAANQSTDVAIVHIYFDRVVAEGSNAGNVSTLTRTNGVLRLTDCEIVVGPHMHASATSWALRIHSGTNTNLPKENDVEITNLRVTTTATRNGQQGWGAVVTAETGRSFRRVSVTETKGNLGILVGCGPKFLNLSRNTIIDAWWRGVQVDWPGTPQWTDARILMDGGWYEGSYSLPVRIQGHQGTSDTTCIMRNVTALNGNQGALGSGHTDAMSLVRFKLLDMRNCVVGDDQSATTLARYYVVTDTAVFNDYENERVGTLTAPAMSSVTSRRFTGSGTGAPSFAAAIGSTYRRLDGGASTALYVNESGSTTWTAK